MDADEAKIPPVCKTSSTGPDYHFVWNERWSKAQIYTNLEVVASRLAEWSGTPKDDRKTGPKVVWTSAWTDLLRWALCPDQLRWRRILIIRRTKWSILWVSDQIRSDQSLSRVWLFATPWIAARQASLSIINSRSSLRLMSIESVMPSSHLILCRPQSFPMSQLFAWGGQSTGISASASFLPKKSQGWSPSEWTGCGCQLAYFPSHFSPCSSLSPLQPRSHSSKSRGKAWAWQHGSSLAKAVRITIPAKCQLYRYQRQTLNPWYATTPDWHQPSTWWQADYTKSFPSWNKQYSFLLDTYSRKAFSFPDHNISAEIVIHEFTKCLIHHHVSHSIASDQGTHFIAN